MNSHEIRKRFLNYFQSKNHIILPSASLIPENDPSVLFNTAGMQPLVPYLLGQKHPSGNRLASIQKCIRTVDIDEVGDNRHLTFFEMMGNWSLGDYFKKEAIEYSFDLLTNKEYGFGLDPNRLYITCFEGDNDADIDTESYNIWKEIIEKNNIDGGASKRIYFLPKKNNWWSPGANGPCGPDTEMFYDITGDLNKGLTKDEYLEADDKGFLVEIWNDVFMEYLKKDDKVVSKLEKQNVDTGSGFERIVMMIQGVNNVFETDIFKDVIQKIKDLSKLDNDNFEKNIKSVYIIADHVRSSVMLIADGVNPSNTDQGYILRRLLRRALRHADILSLPENSLFMIADIFTEYCKDIYENVYKQKETIKISINNEEKKFKIALKQGMKEFNKLTDRLEIGQIIESKDVFRLYESYGFPFEMIYELAKEKGFKLIKEDFDNHFKKHQDVSKIGSENKFKGGLAGDGVMETKYHTATHIMHEALRQVLGKHIGQKGSNITSERMRFDFNFDRKLSEDEIKKIENIVNDIIQKSLNVNHIILKKDEAIASGALHLFNDKYGEDVSVYYIGDNIENAFSKEFCGGPHVKNTSELGLFKIIKEEAVSQGVRRIKAILN